MSSTLPKEGFGGDVGQHLKLSGFLAIVGLVGSVLHDRALQNSLTVYAEVNHTLSRK